MQRQVIVFGNVVKTFAFQSPDAAPSQEGHQDGLHHDHRNELPNAAAGAKAKGLKVTIGDLH